MSKPLGYRSLSVGNPDSTLPCVSIPFSQLAQEQAAQLPGDNSLGHLHNPAAALNQIQQQAGVRHGRDHRPQHHPHHGAAGAHFVRQQHERAAHGGQQRGQVSGAGRGEDGSEGIRQQQQHFGQHGGCLCIFYFG